MTAMAFLHFKRENVDIAIVEVGLGGRLDASNVVTPEISVITSIGLDHCEILGDTIAAIAREKAGIIKQGVPTVIGRLPEEAEDVIRTICRERESELISTTQAYGEDLKAYPVTNLSGGYQRLNAGTAMTVAKALKSKFNLNIEGCETALQKIDWPGRWEERELKHRKIILDVSHNSEGAVWLEENLTSLVDKTGAKPDVVMGTMGEDRARSMVPLVAKYANSLTFVMPQQARSVSFDVLESLVPASFEGAVVRGSIPDLFPSKGVCSLDLPSRHSILVTGSIYLIGEVRERFMEDGPVGQGILQDF